MHGWVLSMAGVQHVCYANRVGACIYAHHRRIGKTLLVGVLAWVFCLSYLLWNVFVCACVRVRAGAGAGAWAGARVRGRVRGCVVRMRVRVCYSVQMLEC